MDNIEKSRQSIILAQSPPSLLEWMRKQVYTQYYTCMCTAPLLCDADCSHNFLGYIGDVTYMYCTSDCISAYDAGTKYVIKMGQTKTIAIAPAIHSLS